MKNYVLGLLVVIGMLAPVKAQAHKAAFFGYLIGQTGFYSLSGRYTGHIGLTRSSEALAGLYDSRAIYGNRQECGNLVLGNRGHGESYDGRWLIQGNRCVRTESAF